MTKDESSVEVPGLEEKSKLGETTPDDELNSEDGAKTEGQEKPS
jgi:hypothetical protein